jgi:hypothetical protein
MHITRKSWHYLRTFTVKIFLWHCPPLLQQMSLFLMTSNPSTFSQSFFPFCQPASLNASECNSTFLQCTSAQQNILEMLKTEFSVQSQVRLTEDLTANMKGKHISQPLVMMVIILPVLNCPYISFKVPYHNNTHIKVLLKIYIFF